MNTKVLLVDDDPNLLKGLVRRLGDKFDLVTAVSADQALQILNQESGIAVVVSDFRMPGMDGIAFLAAVRQLRPNTVRIMLTGYLDSEMAVRAVNEGRISQFLTKPCPTERLRETIAAGLQEVSSQPSTLETPSKTATAQRDPLTGVFHRQQLEEEMTKLEKARIVPIGVIYGDINGLKHINDTLGVDLGDSLLKACGAVFTEALRVGDVVGRWGEDSFVMVLPDTALDLTQDRMHKLMLAFRAKSGEGMPLSVTLACAVTEDVNQELSEVISLAEDQVFQHKMVEERSSRASTLTTLLHTLGEKSEETEEHARRLTETAFEVGRSIGLSDHDMSRLALLAALHDIGKIAIPEQILRKPFRLSDEEWQLMQEHPRIGYRIAQSSEDFEHIADEILSHHERYDGMGYPQQLTGEGIPLLARIISIVDAFDVMTQGRSYKEGMTEEEALAELYRCAGTQFDAELVEVFINYREQRARGVASEHQPANGH